MPELRLSILGPLRAQSGDHDLPLGGRQQRLLLALLLARAGAVVSLPELIDALWDGEPPLSAANSIHRAVGQLRRLIQPGLAVRAAGDRLVRHASGYRLRLDEEMSDLLRFRALARRAATAPDAEAVDLFGSALALWTGPPGAGLESPTRTHPIFVALDAELARTALQAADVALRSGDAARVLPALLRISGWRPLDESLQARVVLALAAQGRQAEALDRFRTVRRRLRDELGLDPGAELRQAQDRVLRQSVGTEPEPGIVVPAAPSRLPGDHPFFSGRVELIARAEALIAEDRRQGRATTLAFDGMPGVGKTTLAVHLAHRLADDYPDGQLYIDLRGYAAQGPPMTALEALHSMLSSLGVQRADRPDELNAAAGLYRGLIAGRRMLVVLDNGFDYAQIRNLLPATPQSLTLVTGRARINPLIIGGARPLEVPLPPVAEIWEGMRKWLGPDRVEAEPESVGHIIERCGRHPLAMAMVVARAIAMPEVPLRQIVEDMALNRGIYQFGDGTENDLTSVFSWSYRALTPAAARLFRLIPLSTDPEISPEAAAALAGVDRHAAAALLRELSAQMLTQVRAGHHQMHDLLRRYAAELSNSIDSAPERAAAAARLSSCRHDPVLSPAV
ncbi:AfsR/SARP family transcriptional regulator [Actinoplanes sp. TBRC 11911]|uniref:AfsR/SARP family transcriptional regulator n=1 Tax=Actinoplanes sp. TBRC 11911 TaxID=2729386 RepID=UPI00145E1F26|nr:BTAD domain-containing putative transcriptional regulator [Actinoplanes sp. TBRC 11911]NMO49670.1 AfsR/SARP family transcriptional regulator [Actinoplanes sp. TBRC 11911]